MRFKSVFFFFAFLLLSTVSNHAQELLEKDIPPEILFKETNREDYGISPDGKYYADILRNNVETDIIIVDIDAYELYQRIPMGHQSVQSIYWLTSKRILFESNGAIYAIDIDGSNKKEIVDRRAEVRKRKSGWSAYFSNMRFNSLLSLLPEKEHQILIETYDMDFNSYIKEVNIFTGERYVVIDGSKYKVNKWILDGQRQIRMGVKFEDDGFEYYEFDREREKLTPFYVMIDDKSYDVGVRGDAYFKPTVQFEGFSADPDVVYITSNVNSDRRRLLSYSLSQKKVLDVLAEDANCDIKEGFDDNLAFMYDFKNHQIAGIRYEGLTPQFRWFSPDMAELHAKLNAKYPRYVHEIFDADDEGKRYVVLQWSDINAGNIGIYDAEEDSYAVMFVMNEELAKYKLSPTRSFVVHSRDGKSIPCYLNLPLDYDKDTPVPLVVIPHGGPWVRDYWSLDPFTQFFTSRGYATLRVNFRGSTGFGIEHMRAGIDNLDGLMIDDIVDAVQELKTSYAINESGVFLYGHSYGGYATYMGLIKYPTVFTAGVAVSAPSDIKGWMKELQNSDNDFAYDFWTVALGNKKKRYMDEISPITYVDELNNPVLIFHGEYDEVIPVEHSKEMEKALRKKGKPVSFEMMRKEGHSLDDSNSMGYILNRSHTFFQKQLKQD